LVPDRACFRGAGRSLEAPEAIDIVLINRPSSRQPAPARRSIRPVAAAIANAVFDATSGRLRRAPLTPDQFRPALA
jgi:nicotinate dehydrogenase subunit B